MLSLWAQVYRTFRYLRRSWRGRVAVVGHSMEPNLRDGDWLLRDPRAYRQRPPIAGDLVVVRDPRLTTRLLIKRVARAELDGSIVLIGDHPAHIDDGASIGPIRPVEVLGRPWFRYWPPKRVGLIH